MFYVLCYVTLHYRSSSQRCQAYEALGQVDSAYKDAREVHRIDPNNPAIQPVLVRLHKAVSLKVMNVATLEK